MAEPTLHDLSVVQADIQRRLILVEGTVPLVVDLHGWFKDAGLDNGTGAKLALLGDMAEERFEQMADQEAIRRVRTLVVHHLRLNTRAGKWVLALIAGLLATLIAGVVGNLTR